jgi:hypothetical protein
VCMGGVVGTGFKKKNKKRGRNWLKASEVKRVGTGQKKMASKVRERDDGPARTRPGTREISHPPTHSLPASIASSPCNATRLEEVKRAKFLREVL